MAHCLITLLSRRRFILIRPNEWFVMYRAFALLREGEHPLFLSEFSNARQGKELRAHLGESGEAAHRQGSLSMELWCRSNRAHIIASRSAQWGPSARSSLSNWLMRLWMHTNPRPLIHYSSLSSARCEQNKRSRLSLMYIIFLFYASRNTMYGARGASCIQISAPVHCSHQLLMHLMMGNVSHGTGYCIRCHTDCCQSRFWHQHRLFFYGNVRGDKEISMVKCEWNRNLVRRNSIFFLFIFHSIQIT
jgi:hypothetical protein